MPKHTTSITLILIFCTLCFSFLKHPSSASADTAGLAINPAVVRAVVKPGKTITQVINLQNQSTIDKEFVAHLQSLADSINGQPIIKISDSAAIPSFFSLANTHITLGQPFSLKAGEKTQLILNITIPIDSPTTDHYFHLVVSEYTRSTTISSTGSQFYGSIVSNLLLTVSPVLHPQTSLSTSSLGVSSDFIFRLGNLYFADNLTPLMLDINVKNDGKHLTTTTGYIEVQDWIKQTQSSISLLPLYLPSQHSRFLQDHSGKHPTFEPHLFNLGTHQIKIKINSENAQYQDQITVILIPFKAIIALFIMYLITHSLINMSLKTKITSPSY